MIYLNKLNFIIDDAIFLMVATAFLVIVGWAWRKSKPFELPQPLPEWFKGWFLTVQVVGGVLPLVVMLLWGVWWGYSSVLIVLVSYFIMLGLQVLFEIATLRWFHSVVWVMVPYLYQPYRIWQFYESFTLLSFESELVWFQNLLIIEIVLWTFNYCFNLSQLPRLFRWALEEWAPVEVQDPLSEALT